MNEQVFTIEEAAKILRVSDKTIRRMIERKEIDATLVGRQWRIPKREIDRLTSNQIEKDE